MRSGSAMGCPHALPGGLGGDTGVLPLSLGVPQAPHGPGGRLHLPGAGGGAAAQGLDGAGGEGGAGRQPAPCLQEGGGGEWGTGGARGDGTWGHTAKRGTRVLGDVGWHRDTRGSTVRVPRGGAARGDPNSPQEPTLSPPGEGVPAGHGAPGGAHRPRGAVWGVQDELRIHRHHHRGRPSPVPAGSPGAGAAPAQHPAVLAPC